MGRLALVTGPTTEPISLAAAKAHLRVDHDDEDEYIDALITAARTHVENHTQRALLSQTWDYYTDSFSGSYLTIPKLPVQSVTSVKYRITDGTETTWSALSYLVETRGDWQARLQPVYGGSWPSFSPYPVNAVVIRFVAGYASVAAIPAPIIHAIKLMLGHLYTNREASVTASVGSQVMTLGITNLLAPYRVMGV
jgi:uncharacterized phiE125 gp8 family phage protein